MAFDYKDERTNAMLRDPKSLPEYEDEANNLLIKVRGSFPYESNALESGIFVLRCMLQRRDKGADVTQEQIEKACLEMFGALPGSDASADKSQNVVESKFDYRDPKVSEALSAPEKLPEYEEKANAVIIKALGEFPYGSRILVDGISIIRHIIYRTEHGEDFTDEQIEEVCHSLFC